MLWTSAVRAKLRLRVLPPKAHPRASNASSRSVFPAQSPPARCRSMFVVTSSIATLEEGARSWLNYGRTALPAASGHDRHCHGDCASAQSHPARAYRRRDRRGFCHEPGAGSVAGAHPARRPRLLSPLPELITAGIYERGEFSAADTRNTGIALAIAGLGLPAFVLVKVLAPAFFRAGKTRKPPMRFALAAVVVNFVFALLLFFGGLGLCGSGHRLQPRRLGQCRAAGGLTLRTRGLLQIDKRLAAHRAAPSAGRPLAHGRLWSGRWRRGCPAFLQPALPTLGASLVMMVSLLLVVGAGAAVFGGACLTLGGAAPRQSLPKRCAHRKRRKTLPGGSDEGLSTLEPSPMGGYTPSPCLHFPFFPPSAKTKDHERTPPDRI